MEALKQCVAIGVAGFFGALARFGVASACGRLFPKTSFPIGTFIINISGSLFLGWFLASAGNRFQISDMTKLAIATGFVGAYTTFSAFVYESDKLMRGGESTTAFLYLLTSVVAGLAAVWAGAKLA